MTVTIYSKGDTGAPALPAATNTYDRAKWFMDLMKLCLVTGYGSKAGAGWSVVYEDNTTNKKRLALTNGNGVIEFVTWGAQGVGIFIWDSITSPGAGRIVDDSWPGLVSTGVNGWQQERITAGSADSEQKAAMYVVDLNISQDANIAWEVYANDKSAWFITHYPQSNSSAAAGTAGAKGTNHPQIFFGAIKSPDLLRDQQGNFFVLYGNSASTQATPSPGQTGGINYCWGLRTPQASIPSAANSSVFVPYAPYPTGAASSTTNPFNSLRIVLPIPIYYDGNDVYKPAGLGAGVQKYTFGTLPGIGMLADPAAASPFWQQYTAQYSSWFYEKKMFGGVLWKPYKLSGGSTSSFNSCAITADDTWWP